MLVYLSASWGTIGGPPQTPVDHHSTITLRGSRGPQLVPIIPRDVSLSDSECDIFLSRGEHVPTRWNLYNGQAYNSPRGERFSPPPLGP